MGHALLNSILLHTMSSYPVVLFLVNLSYNSKQPYLARVESGKGCKGRSLPSLVGVFDISEMSVSASGVDTITLSVLGQDSSNLEDEDWLGSVVPFSLVGIS